MKWLPSIAGLFWLAAAPAGSAWAVVFVNGAAPGPIHDGTSWARACLTVQAGVDGAAAGTQVWVAQGVYTERLTLKKGVALYGGFSGTETTLGQRNPALRPTILDGAKAGTVVKVEVGATTATRLDGFTVRNGYGIFGGGIACSGAAPTIANNVITGNVSEGYGGGIALDRASHAVIVDNLIQGNTASGIGGDGGGIACVQHSQITGGSNATIARNVIRGNQASQNGGGIAVWQSSPTITNNTIVDNSCFVVSEAKGEFWIDDATEITITRLSRGGGGIFVSELRMDEGGAGGSRAAPVIRNNIIAGNGGAFDGGGILVRAADLSVPIIANNTVVANCGAGISFRNAGPRIANNIVAYNLSGIAGGANPLGSPAVLRANCVYGNGLPSLPPGDYAGWPDPTGTAGNLRANPLLAAPAFGELHIQPGSPCRNAGDAAEASPQDTDMDGQARIQGGRVDIGADECDGAMRPFTARVCRVAPSGNDAGDGATWATAKRTVGAALDALAPTGGEVWVQAGTYAETLRLPPFAYLYGGYAGTETARDQRNPRANVTTLDGGRRSAVVLAIDGFLVSGIDGFTIQNGLSPDGGGGIWCETSGPYIRGNRIVNNASVKHGAGVYAWQGHPVVVENHFESNVPQAGGFGGGFYGDGSVCLILENTFAKNGNDGWGGGIEVHNGAPVIAWNDVHENAGCGIYCLSCLATVYNNAVYSNRTSGPGAGLLFINCKGRVCDNLVINNQATNIGAGIGVYGSDVPSAVLTIANNTLAGNNANSFGAEGGGGIGYYLLAPGTLTIANNAIAYNSSGIAQQYRDPPGPTADLDRNAFYRNIGQDIYGNWVDRPYLNRPAGATDLLDTDPQFVSLSPIDLHLRASSPLINTGNDAFALLSDRDGDRKPRLLDGHVDIGAYEFGTLAPYGAADLRQAARAAGSLYLPTLAEAFRLNVINEDASFGCIDFADAAAIARKLTGLTPNP